MPRHCRLLQRRIPLLASLFFALLPALAPAADPDPTAISRIVRLGALPLPEIGLMTPEQDGPITPEVWRGKVVLLNFWATWCAPCVKEMPSLVALQKAYGERGLLVVPASQDLTGFLTIKSFYRQRKLEGLGVYWDKGMASYKRLGLRALPTSILLDRNGMAVARVEGEYDWMSDDARALIEKTLTQ